MSTLVKTNRWLIGNEETVGYRDEYGCIVGTCGVKELSAHCFKAIQNGKYFEIQLESGDDKPVKLVLSRNRRSLVVRDRFGGFLGLVSLRYLAEKLNNIIRGWSTNFEINLVELSFGHLPTADVPLLEPSSRRGG